MTDKPVRPPFGSVRWKGQGNTQLQQFVKFSDELGFWIPVPRVPEDEPDEVDLVQVGNPPPRQGS